jgi:5-methylcytosine-specific restriction endonuclease McrA
MCQWKFEDETLCLDRATDVDHIVPGDDHSLTNLRSLCGRHHRFKSSQEGAHAAAAKRRQIAKKFQRVEEHPGLMSK